MKANFQLLAINIYLGKTEWNGRSSPSELEALHKTEKNIYVNFSFILTLFKNKTP